VHEEAPYRLVYRRGMFDQLLHIFSYLCFLLQFYCTMLTIICM